jgi:glycosyltransferase involved in cell wall biosynthesis
MKSPLVAVGCPVRNRAWIIRDYLADVHRICCDPKPVEIYVVDNSDDDTEAIIRATAPHATVHVLRNAAPGHLRHEYGANGYAHLADVRNELLAMFLATKAEYLLSIDSDVLVPPDILNAMLPLADVRTIVGAGISNIEGRELDGQTPGNFLVREGGVLRHPASYPICGHIDVDVTGACALIPRTLVEAGARYGPHPQGEDVAFCQAAQRVGGRAVVTFMVRPHHQMRPPC